MLRRNTEACNAEERECWFPEELIEMYEALQRFKSNSWRALNSYAHAGIHPLRRHHEGYPAALIQNVLCNLNGLGVLGCMQAAVLGGEQPLQTHLLEVAGRFSQCLPAPL